MTIDLLTLIICWIGFGTGLLLTGLNNYTPEEKEKWTRGWRISVVVLLLIGWPLLPLALLLVAIFKTHKENNGQS